MVNMLCVINHNTSKLISSIKCAFVYTDELLRVLTRFCGNARTNNSARGPGEA